MKKLTDLIRPDLREFAPYSSARMEHNANGILLNANESPWALNSSNQQSTLNRYLEQQPAALLQALANYYGMEGDSLLVTRGADECIDLLVRLFCTPFIDTVMVCPPTYGMYAVSSKLQGADIINVPLLASNYQLDIENILDRFNDRVKLLFLCSPNNPTGNLLNTDDILFLAENLLRKAIIVIDEAYIDFAQTPSLISMLKDYKNIVILRTFSKAFAMAAARIGILLGDKEIVSWLKKILAPYPLSALSVEAVLSALTPSALQLMQQRVACSIEERKRLINELNLLPIVEKVWSSQANFILTKFKIPIEAICLQKNIVLRNVEDRCGKNTMRISIGTIGENNILLKVLGEL